MLPAGLAPGPAGGPEGLPAEPDAPGTGPPPGRPGAPSGPGPGLRLLRQHRQADVFGPAEDVSRTGNLTLGSL